MRKLFVMLFIFSAIGCSVTNEVPLAEYKTDFSQKLPPITVFYLKPPEDFRQECVGFDNQSFLHHCKLNTLHLNKFAQEVRRAEIFDKVLYTDSQTEYRILISTALYNFEEAEELGGIAVASATLFLAPATITQSVKVEAGLYWNHQLLKKMSYDLPMEFRASLLNPGQDSDEDIAKSVASHVIRDIQSEELYSPQYLASLLGSSNYSTDFDVPDEINDYILDGQFLYNNPLLGVQVRFVDESVSGDYMDIFIYPIRAGYWDDEMGILNKEAVRAKKDIELLNKKNNLATRHIGENESRVWTFGNKKVSGLMFTSKYDDEVLSNEYSSQTYLAVINDKFIKVRHSSLKEWVEPTTVERFVEQLMSDIVVPEESIFMARQRKRWRDDLTL